MRGRSARTLTSLVLALALIWPAGAAAQAEAGSGTSGSTDATQDASGEKKRERRWGRHDEDDTEKEWGRSYEIDERTGKRLVEAREHLMEERYDEAEEALGKLRLRSLNPLERSQVFRTLAYVAYGRDDYDGARDYLEKTIGEEVLSRADEADIRYQIAQLYLAEERWSDVVESLKRWFAMVENPNSSAYYLLAIAFYQLDDLDSALEPAQQAVDLAKDPQEGWFQLLLALRLTRKEYVDAAPILEELIERYPKKVYWIQLSTVHGALGDYEEALIPLQLAYSQGLLTDESELRRLAELLLYLDLPYRAAQVVERGIETKTMATASDTFELLSNSWIAAREFEKAVTPLERAADLSDNGELYVRLAQVHIQREKWSDAAEVLKLALDKGGLDNAGDAQLLMGIAYFSQKRPQQALTWFARAREHPETQDEADNWLKYIRRELRSS